MKECGSIHNHMNELHSKLCPLRAVHNRTVGFCFFSMRGQISPSGSPSLPYPSLPSSMPSSSTHQCCGTHLPLPCLPAAAQRFHGDLLLMNQRTGPLGGNNTRPSSEQRRKEREQSGPGGGSKECGRQVGCGRGLARRLYACPSPHLRANLAKRERLRGGAGSGRSGRAACALARTGSSAVRPAL